VHVREAGQPSAQRRRLVVARGAVVEERGDARRLGGQRRGAERAAEGGEGLGVASDGAGGVGGERTLGLPGVVVQAGLDLELDGGQGADGRGRGDDERRFHSIYPSFTDDRLYYHRQNQVC
jgi:hypothetical protein